MDNKFKAIMAFVVAGMMLAIPLAAMTNDSDAATIVPGEAGIGFDSQFSAAKAVRLYPESDLLAMASESPYQFIDESNFLISDSTLSGLSLSGSITEKIEGSQITLGWSVKIFVDADMTVIALNDGGYIFKPIERNKEVIDEVGRNVSAAGDCFKIRAYYMVMSAAYETFTVERNSEGKYYLTSAGVDRTDSVTYSIGGTYNYTVNDQAAERYFEVDYNDSSSIKATVTPKYVSGEADVNEKTPFTFKSECEEALSRQASSTSVDNNPSHSKQYFLKELNVTDDYDGLSEVILSKFMMNPTDYHYFDSDITLDELLFYDATSNMALLNSTVDPLLRSNDTMKLFLDDNGHVVETYAAADEITQEDHWELHFNDRDDAKFYSDLGYGFLSFVLGVIVIILLICLIRKK